MNIKIESPVVLEVNILEHEDADVVLQRQVSQWLQRVYGATPTIHLQSGGVETGGFRGESRRKVVVAVAVV